MALILGITGLAGSGKSTAAGILEKQGFQRVHFGDAVFEELEKRHLERNETNERKVREELRSRWGLEALAFLSLARLKELVFQGTRVVIDGVYSWEEVGLLKEHFSRQFCLLALHCSPLIRYGRLKLRPERALLREAALARDLHELDVLHKGPTLALADWHIVNESSPLKLKKALKQGLQKWRKDQVGTVIS